MHSYFAFGITFVLMIIYIYDEYVRKLETFEISDFH